MVSGFESEFPANSHRSREPEVVVEKKTIEAVTEGPVIRRKTPLGKRFASLFIAGDSDTVWKYVAMEVMLPGARDIVADAVTQYVERMIFGEARSVSRRTGLRPTSSTSAGYVSYNRYAQAPKASPEAPRAGALSVRNRPSHNVDDIVLSTRVEAENVIDRLFDLIAKYEQATVADLYELVHETPNFVDNKWGWRDIRGADVQRVRDGYLLRLSAPIALE